MAIPLYLAMTASEIASQPPTHRPVAWMACHFSPEDPGLSDLPDALPPNSMLTLNDRFPIEGHDLDLIAKQLAETADSLACCGILLDFQKERNRKTSEFVRFLSNKLPFPVGVSDLYAKDTDRAVFVSPVPSDVMVSEHLLPWKDREIWLDLAPVEQTVTVTEDGPHYSSLADTMDIKAYLTDHKLHTHYRIEISDSPRFHLIRTTNDLLSLLRECEGTNVTKAVALHQEWTKSPS